MSYVQPVGIAIMAVIAIVIVVRFIIDCRKDERFITDTLPSAGKVSRGRVHDDLEHFKHYRSLWTFNRLAVTSCGTAPNGAADEYIFKAGTGSVRILCLLARDVAHDDGVASLVGEAPARFLPRIGAFSTWSWPDSNIQWHVKLRYDKNKTEASHETLEAIMYKYHDIVVQSQLSQPWFIELAGRDVLVVFPLAKVHKDLDKVVGLHARLHGRQQEPHEIS